jgi:hypothetical protein
MGMNREIHLKGSHVSAFISLVLLHESDLAAIKALSTINKYGAIILCRLFIKQMPLWISVPGISVKRRCGTEKKNKRYIKPHSIMQKNNSAQTEHTISRTVFVWFWKLIEPHSMNNSCIRQNEEQNESALYRQNQQANENRTSRNCNNNVELQGWAQWRRAQWLEHWEFFWNFGSLLIGSSMKGNHYLLHLKGIKQTFWKRLSISKMLRKSSPI